MCEAMKWAHLPEAGGLYDQHPDLLDGFALIFGKRAEYEDEQERKRQAEERRKTGKSR